MSALVGGYGGLNQTLVRRLLAYSSIGHTGWLLAARAVSKRVALVYFSVYALISFSVFYCFWDLSCSIALNLRRAQVSWTYVLALIALISLGGLPPLVGFVPKILVVYSLVTSTAN